MKGNEDEVERNREAEGEEGEEEIEEEKRGR